MYTVWTIVDIIQKINHSTMLISTNYKYILLKGISIENHYKKKTFYITTMCVKKKYIDEIILNLFSCDNVNDNSVDR